MWKKHFENIRMILSIICFFFLFALVELEAIYRFGLCLLGIFLFPFPKGWKGVFVRLGIMGILTTYVYYFQPQYLQMRPVNPDGLMRVSYIDVGQGESAFIELPDGKTMLVDAGTFDESRKAIQYIRNLGYTTIDYFFVSHPHSDHIGGASNIMQAFRVKNTYLAYFKDTLQPDSYSYQSYLNTIQQQNIHYETVIQQYDFIVADDYSIDIIWPVSDYESEDLNQYSMMLRLNYKDKSFFFTGDAGFGAEYALDPTIPLSANVLKVGHHGSSDASSTQFLNRVNPDIAIISVGIDNEFNQPNLHLLETLESYGIDVYRTDLHGTIVIETDGHSLSVAE